MYGTQELRSRIKQKMPDDNHQKMSCAKKHQVEALNWGRNAAAACKKY